MKSLKLGKLLSSSCLIAAAAMTAPAFAEDEVTEDSVATLGTVFVTAQKREQNLQDIPASVSNVPSDKIEALLGAGENIRALTGRAPGLIVESSNGRQSPRFYIRGLGNTDFDVNANQPVLMLYDDIVLENSVLKSVPLFDIERVEVLNGPQGTLFGRNTTAGVVKIESVKPSFEQSGYIDIGVGQLDTRSLSVAYGGGITETLAGRFSLNYLSRGGWIDNAVTGEEYGGFDELAYRGQLLWEPNEDLSALLKVHGFYQEGDSPAPFYANALEVGSEGVRSGFDPSVVYWDSAPEADIDHFGISLNTEYEFSDTITLTSITGYDTLESFSSGDVDGGSPFMGGSVGDLGFNPFPAETGDGLDSHYQLDRKSVV